jgi:hypothetical protein
MQSLDVSRRGAGDLFGLGDDVEGIGGRVDDRCAGDADFWCDVGCADVAVRDGCDTLGGVDERVFPEVALRGVIPFGVEGVNAVMLGGDEEDVVRPLAGDRDARLEQRLGVDVAVGG